MEFREFLQTPFTDVNGLKRLLLGSVILVFPILNIWCFAYWGEAMLAGMQRQLHIPFWTDWGKRFKLGLMIFAAVLIYLYFPLLMIVLAFALPGPFGLIGVISAVLLGVMLPYAIAHLITTQRFGSIFDFAIIFRLIRLTFRSYISAYLLTAAMLFLFFIVLLSQPFLGFAGFLFSFYLLTVFFMAVGSWYTTAMISIR